MKTSLKVDCQYTRAFVGEITLFFLNRILFQNLALSLLASVNGISGAVQLKNALLVAALECKC